MSDEAEKVQITVFTCGPQCVDGTENHIWDGLTAKIDNGESATCSRCGKAMIDVCMWWDDGLQPPL